MKFTIDNQSEYVPEVAYIYELYEIIMNTLHIPNPELGEKNIFEEIFELLERHRLKLEGDFPLGNFYDIISDFDAAFQEFNSNEINQKNVYVFNELLNYTIKNFLVIFKTKGFTDEPIFYAFKRFIAFFTIVLKEANTHQTERDIKRNFFENFPSLKTDINKLEEDAQALYIHHYGQELSPEQEAIIKFEDEFPHEIAPELYPHLIYSQMGGIVYFQYLKNGNRDLIIEARDGVIQKYPIPPNCKILVEENSIIKEGVQLFQDLERTKQIIIYCNDFIAKDITWNEVFTRYDITDEKYYMIIEISIDTEEKSVDKLLSPLWLITSAIEKIDNVTLELEDIFKGSLRAAIKIWMKDLLAKEETKAVLETTKEAAVKAITAGGVSFTEVKKSRQETKKLTLENEKLETEIKQSPTDQEVKFERALEIQKKMLENEKLQIENTQAKIKIIEQLSGLATKGIIEADMIRIDINDILYLLKDKGEIKEIGPDISEIS